MSATVTVEGTAEEQLERGRLVMRVITELGFTHDRVMSVVMEPRRIRVNEHLGAEKYRTTTLTADTARASWEVIG